MYGKLFKKSANKYFWVIIFVKNTYSFFFVLERLQGYFGHVALEHRNPREGWKSNLIRKHEMRSEKVTVFVRWGRYNRKQKLKQKQERERGERREKEREKTGPTSAEEVSVGVSDKPYGPLPYTVSLSLSPPLSFFSFFTKINAPVIILYYFISVNQEVKS